MSVSVPYIRNQLGVKIFHHQRLPLGGFGRLNCLLDSFALSARSSCQFYFIQPPAFAAFAGAAGRRFALVFDSMSGLRTGPALVFATAAARPVIGEAEGLLARSFGRGIETGASTIDPDRLSDATPVPGWPTFPAKIRFLTPMLVPGLFNARIAAFVAPEPMPTPKAATPVHMAMLPAV
ncbi:hypothetical protein BKM03_18110 [Pseudomonas avellanae]|uniref:Uncharacterized protein n=1 Tax=Pseudomonas avellanae TaxID=46257 RepID=A0AAD0E257_9PSED|nr:hypothetical protein [Pseudomonas avellanae]AVB20920.1 hypothetical protein BKM03_18110 [Pseudomonas avellanae]